MEWKIYKITNTKNAKVYIGQTKNGIKERLSGHFTAARQLKQFRFYHAIRKYGEASFVIEQIDTAQTLEEANQKEAYHIDQYLSNHPGFGYNATKGGTGGWMIGRLSEEKQKEWRESVSKANKGENNATYCGTTDEQIKDLLKEFAMQYGYICGITVLCGYGIEKGTDIPKSFTKFRFGGSYKSLAKMVAKELNMQYNAHARGEKRKISIYYKNLSKNRSYKRKG